jgi:hypothetical protein
MPMPMAHRKKTTAGFFFPAIWEFDKLILCWYQKSTVKGTVQRSNRLAEQLFSAALKNQPNRR